MLRPQTGLLRRGYNREIWKKNRADINIKQFMVFSKFQGRQVEEIGMSFVKLYENVTDT